MAQDRPSFVDLSAQMTPPSVLLPPEPDEHLAALASALQIGEDGTSERYSVPLAMSTGQDADTIEQQYPNAVLARISGARKGLLYDGLFDDGTCRIPVNDAVPTVTLNPCSLPLSKTFTEPAPRPSAARSPWPASARR